MTEIRMKVSKAPKVIRDKVHACQPLTAKQKLAVLKKARALLDTNYGSGEWHAFINGVETFCLYGALEAVTGLHPSSVNDKVISQCSLTSTLFDAIPNVSKGRVHSIALFQQRADAAMESGNAQQAAKYANWVQSEKVAALQCLNDNAGKEAVIALVDETIKRLEDA